MKERPVLTLEDFKNVANRKELITQAQVQGVNLDQYVRDQIYEIELRKLQMELVNLQRWIKKEGIRLVIIFEGRDAAGKGGSIKRFTQRLNPRSMRIVALNKPTTVESGQWYFRRYAKRLSNPGEMVFFDRSWYNRAVVEPVMGFCTPDQYEEFMVQVPEFEHMLYEDGVKIVKFWFSITKEEQLKRIQARMDNPMKQWKVSPVDMEGQKLWDKYTYYRDQMFSMTHTPYSPWVIVKTNDKRSARLESIRYILSKFEYDGKENAQTSLSPDPNIIFRYYRAATD
jgi:polyphosphate kinase 2